MLITCAIPTCYADPTTTVRLANHRTIMVCADHIPVRVFFPDGSTNPVISRRAGHALPPGQSRRTASRRVGLHVVAITETLTSANNALVQMLQWWMNPPWYAPLLLAALWVLGTLASTTTGVLWDAFQDRRRTAPR